jgi:hypothetical protein
MARLFNVEVFNQTIGSGRDYFTADEFYSMLGSADTMLVQILVDSAIDAATVVTIGYESSNVSQPWAWIPGSETASITVTSLGSLPTKELLQLPHPDDGLGAFGRFKVTTTNTGASVRIVVCGRSN